MDVPSLANGLKAGAVWGEIPNWSGARAEAWAFLISDTESKTALAWGATPADVARHAMPLAVPAILRREGILDAHGAIVAPDRLRPDDGLFISGVSGAGKSTLMAAAVSAGARFLSDDSNAIGLADGQLHAWARRPARASLSPRIADDLFPSLQTSPFNEKVVLALDREFPLLCAEHLRVRGVLFLESGRQTQTSVTRLLAAESYRRLILGHPMLTLDRGARPCFPTVRALSSLPAWQVIRGPELLRPDVALKLLRDCLNESHAS